MGCFQMLREFSIVSGRELDGDALEALEMVMHGHKHIDLGFSLSQIDRINIQHLHKRALQRFSKLLKKTCRMNFRRQRRKRQSW